MSNWLTWFVVIVLGTLMLAAAVYLLQGQLIYFPSRYSTESLAREAGPRSLAMWPNSDEGYRGLVALGSTGERGTVLVFHGNGGSALDRFHYVAALEPLGFRVLLAEYSGYGAREGRPSERALVADARSTFRLAREQFGGPVYVWGESLGCGVATAVAADPSLEVDGLALVTPFSSLPDMAQAVYRFPPVRWLVRDKYDSVANLQEFEKSVAVLVAGRDELIPRDQPQRLYDSLAAEKRMWVFEGAGHNTWPAWPEEPWWGEVAGFLEGGSSGGL